ncbi:hypothetical protein D2E70_08425 [Mycobacteroides abscessus]|uniref:hypothetical protein n=1 Tax=Mycobacteroides abscessus TaxID=36809 RepID=UPI000E68C2B9|nr:hypothetical protein [Mycobacteroides abscessus]RIS72873.1 hypothetical protein D2E70_08425 [Mycobacteroides abscessus]
MSDIVQRLRDAVNFSERHSDDYHQDESLWAVAREAADEIEALQKRAIPETVTRIDVIGPLRNEFWSDHWAVSIQDGGRTVKLFAEGDGMDAYEERNAALAKDISEYARKLGGQS